MKHRRSRRIISRRVTETQRSATEEAYLNSIKTPSQYTQPTAIQQPETPPQYHQPVILQRPTKKKKEPLPIGWYLVVLVLATLLCLTLWSDANNTNNSKASPIMEPRYTSTDTAVPSSPNENGSIDIPTPYFQNGSGYTVECKDGTYSYAGGKRRACSHHGGELRP